MRLSAGCRESSPRQEEDGGGVAPVGAGLGWRRVNLLASLRFPASFDLLPDVRWMEGVALDEMRRRLELQRARAEELLVRKRRSIEAVERRKEQLQEAKEGLSGEKARLGDLQRLPLWPFPPRLCSLSRLTCSLSKQPAATTQSCRT